MKELIESCIADLMNNQPLSTIFLKIQTISFYLKNYHFKKWFDREKNGYETVKDLPDYRKTRCQVFANLNNPFKGVFNNYHVPVDQIRNEVVRDSLVNCLFCESIIELENIVISNEEGNIRKYVPGMVYGEVQKLFSTGYYVDTVWQTVSRSTIANIVESVKSKLLQFFLEMNEQFNNDINFDIMTKKNEIDKIISQTINAGIYIADSGIANLSDSIVTGGKDNCIIISNEAKTELEVILVKIEDLANEIDGDKSVIVNAIFSIREELENKTPRPKFLKTAFNALKAISVGVIANKLSPLVDLALETIINYYG